MRKVTKLRMFTLWLNPNAMWHQFVINIQTGRCKKWRFTFKHTVFSQIHVNNTANKPNFIERIYEWIGNMHTYTLYIYKHWYEGFCRQMPGGVSGSWPWSMPTVSGTPPLLPTRRRTLWSSTGTCTSDHCTSSNPRTSRSARGSWTATPCLTTGSPSTRSKWPWVWGGKKYYSIPPSSARGRPWTGSCFCWGKGHWVSIQSKKKSQWCFLRQMDQSW